VKHRIAIVFVVHACVVTRRSISTDERRIKPTYYFETETFASDENIIDGRCSAGEIRYETNVGSGETSKTILDGDAYLVS